MAVKRRTRQVKNPLALGHVSAWLDGGKNPYSEAEKKPTAAIARATARSNNSGTSVWFTPVIAYLVVVSLTLVAGEIVNPYYEQPADDKIFFDNHGFDHSGGALAGVIGVSVAAVVALAIYNEVHNRKERNRLEQQLKHEIGDLMDKHRMIALTIDQFVAESTSVPTDEENRIKDLFDEMNDATNQIEATTDRLNFHKSIIQ